MRSYRISFFKIYSMHSTFSEDLKSDDRFFISKLFWPETASSTPIDWFVLLDVSRDEHENEHSSPAWLLRINHIRGVFSNIMFSISNSAISNICGSKPSSAKTWKYVTEILEKIELNNAILLCTHTDECVEIKFILIICFSETKNLMLPIGNLFNSSATYLVTKKEK